MSDVLKAQCESAEGDYITAETSTDKVKFESYRGFDYRVNAFVSPEAVRIFAHGLLVLANEVDGKAPESEELAEGNRVIVTDGERLGDTGTLESIDRYDPDLPYLVEFEDHRSVWVRRVHKASAPAASESARAALLARAREVDPNATGAGLVAIAEYLSS